MKEYEVGIDLTKSQEFIDTNLFPIASLQFELTSHCNVECKHCYNNSGVNNEMEDAMTAEKWISFAKYLAERGGVYETILSGGEPLLLGESLFKIMDILHGSDKYFMLLTNGYLLTEEMVKRLKKYHYHWLQVSIDGISAEYHDAFRKRRGSWENAVKGAKIVSNNGIPLKIAHCVTPYNIYNINEMCDFAYFLGASEIIAGKLCFSGRVTQNQNLMLSKEQERFLFNKIEENALKYKGRMRVKSSNSIRLGLERHMKKPDSSAIIRPNGDIRIDGMAPFVIGNILHDDFSEIWKKKIKMCWNDPRVKEYISNFDENDKNLKYINYVEKDINI